MNVTQLFVGNLPNASLTHIGTAASRSHRTADQLAANVADLSRALTEVGIRYGDSVLVSGGCRVELAESILATINVGAVAVPVNALAGSNNICSIVAETRPRCCIFEDAPVSSVQNALEQCGSLIISLKASPEAKERGWRTYSDLVGPHTGPLEFPNHPEDQRALILHGSGSSGTQKSIAMTHGSLLTLFEYTRFIYSQYSDGPDVLIDSAPIITCLPITHIAGFLQCFLGLMNGHPTYLLSTFVPESFLRLVEETRCSRLLLVPSMYRSLLKDPYLHRMDKSALRFCITGGESCPMSLLAEIEQAFCVPAINSYGMTECLSGIGHLRSELFRRIKPGSCGKQLFGEISLRDAGGREHSDIGELWVRNATVHPCYIDARLNEARLHQGWFKTGDLFYRDEDGDYFHRGRVDDMFICNGKNIYPLEIETLLSRHPAVEMACAAPVAALDRGIVAGAMVIRKQMVSATELQTFFLREGPTHAMPQVICFVDSLPLLGPGKVDRRRVEQLLTAHLMCAGAP